MTLNLFKSDIECDEPNPIFGIILFLIFTVICIKLLYQHLYFDDTLLNNVNMKPFSEPIQTSFTEDYPKKIFVEANGSKAYLIPQAGYKLYGRVYTKHYVPVKMSFGTVMPYDMAIGWGRMADKDMFKRMKMRYALFDRVVYWQYKESPLSQEEINDSFSNNHLIPANKNVKKGLSKLNVKDIVYLEGYLVNVENYKRDGSLEMMKTSLYRTDEGLGACEVIYITRLVSKHGEFK